MRTEACLSMDRLYRYWLLRVWNEALPIYAVIGTNPSVADERANDATVRKVIGFGERLGFGGVLMLNVGAFRATDPKEWRAARDPLGPENTIDHIKSYLIRFCTTHVIVAAWGKPAMSCLKGTMRANRLKREIPGMFCWGKNKDGSPRHPLMLPYSTPLEPFN